MSPKSSSGSTEERPDYSRLCMRGEEFKFSSAFNQQEEENNVGKMGSLIQCVRQHKTGATYKITTITKNTNKQKQYPHLGFA